MKTVRIIRTLTGDQGTSGVLVLPGLVLYTLELPWRDNRNGISCIPEGEYPIWHGPSPSRPAPSYRFEHPRYCSDVPGRGGVLLHSGNFAGDRAKGYLSHVQGCVLLGQGFGTMQGQLAILQSKPAVRLFEKALNYEPARLIIERSY